MSAGSRVSTSLMASVPPVEAPMAMICSLPGAAGRAALREDHAGIMRVLDARAPPGRGRGRSWARAAILTLAMSSCASSLRRARPSIAGLATKSTAPRRERVESHVDAVLGGARST